MFLAALMTHSRAKVPLLNELPTALPLSSFTATEIAATFIDVSDLYRPDDSYPQFSEPVECRPPPHRPRSRPSA